MSWPAMPHPLRNHPRLAGWVLVVLYFLLDPTSDLWALHSSDPLLPLLRQNVILPAFGQRRVGDVLELLPALLVVSLLAGILANTRRSTSARVAVAEPTGTTDAADGTGSPLSPEVGERPIEPDNANGTPANRNEPAIQLVAEYVNRAVPMVTAKPSDAVARAHNEMFGRFLRAEWISTGAEREILEQFQSSVQDVIAEWRREQGTGTSDRNRSVRELRRLGRRASAELRISGLTTTVHDRENWLPSIRSLMRRRRDDGLRLLRQGDAPFAVTPPTVDPFDDLEVWAIRTGDLLLDAYGAGLREQFRDALRGGGGGIRSFEPAIQELGRIIEQAEQMRLIDSFRLEDWESGLPSEPHTSEVTLPRSRAEP